MPQKRVRTGIESIPERMAYANLLVRIFGSGSFGREPFGFVSLNPYLFKRTNERELFGRDWKAYAYDRLALMEKEDRVWVREGDTGGTWK